MDNFPLRPLFQPVTCLSLNSVIHGALYRFLRHYRTVYRHSYAAGTYATHYPRVNEPLFGKSYVSVKNSEIYFIFFEHVTYLWDFLDSLFRDKFEYTRNAPPCRWPETVTTFSDVPVELAYLLTVPAIATHLGFQFATPPSPEALAVYSTLRINARLIEMQPLPPPDTAMPAHIPRLQIFLSFATLALFRTALPMEPPVVLATLYEVLVHIASGRTAENIPGNALAFLNHPVYYPVLASVHNALVSMVSATTPAELCVSSAMAEALTSTRVVDAFFRSVACPPPHVVAAVPGAISIAPVASITSTNVAAAVLAASPTAMAELRTFATHAQHRGSSHLVLVSFQGFSTRPVGGDFIVDAAALAMGAMLHRIPEDRRAVVMSIHGACLAMDVQTLFYTALRNFFRLLRNDIHFDSGTARGRMCTIQVPALEIYQGALMGSTNVDTCYQATMVLTRILPTYMRPADNVRTHVRDTCATIWDRMLDVVASVDSGKFGMYLSRAPLGEGIGAILTCLVNGSTLFVPFDDMFDRIKMCATNNPGPAGVWGRSLDLDLCVATFSESRGVQFEWRGELQHGRGLLLAFTARELGFALDLLRCRPHHLSDFVKLACLMPGMCLDSSRRNRSLVGAPADCRACSFTPSNFGPAFEFGNAQRNAAVDCVAVLCENVIAVPLPRPQALAASRRLLALIDFLLVWAMSRSHTTRTVSSQEEFTKAYMSVCIDPATREPLRTSTFLLSDANIRALHTHVLSTQILPDIPILSLVPSVPVPGWPSWKPGGANSPVLPAGDSDLLRIALQYPFPTTPTLRASHNSVHSPCRSPGTASPGGNFDNGSSSSSSSSSSVTSAGGASPPPDAATGHTDAHVRLLGELMRIREMDRIDLATHDNYIAALDAMCTKQRAQQGETPPSPMTPLPPVASPAPKRPRLSITPPT